MLGRQESILRVAHRRLALFTTTATTPLGNLARMSAKVLSKEELPASEAKCVAARPPLANLLTIWREDGSLCRRFIGRIQRGRR